VFRSTATVNRTTILVYTVAVPETEKVQNALAQRWGVGIARGSRSRLVAICVVMAAGTVVPRGGTVGPSVLTVMVMAVRTVVRMTMTGPAVTAGSPPSDRGGNVVGCTSYNAGNVVLLYGKGVVWGIRGGGIPKMRWLRMRVRATAKRRGGGRDVVCRH
jgi:hypothetical protein